MEWPKNRRLNESDCQNSSLCNWNYLLVLPLLCARGTTTRTVVHHKFFRFIDNHGAFAITNNYHNTRCDSNSKVQQISRVYVMITTSRGFCHAWKGFTLNKVDPLQKWGTLISNLTYIYDHAINNTRTTLTALEIQNNESRTYCNVLGSRAR